MALLNFYKGQFSGLDAVTKKEGNVYVTTDEQAIYVDISDSKRIRLGQIVNFTTLTEFQNFLKNTNPPYSKEAFYYVADSNALLKWASSEGTTGAGDNAIAGTWKQINSTSDVQADLSALTARVVSAESAINTINGSESTSGSLAKNLKDAKDYTDGQIKTVTDAATALTGRVETAEGEIDTLQADMTQAKSDIAANTSAIGTNTANIATNASDIDAVEERAAALENTVGDNTKGLVKKVNDLDTTVNDATSGLVKKVADLTASVADNASAISTNATNIGTNKTAIEKNASDIAALQTAVGTGADGLASKVTDLQGRMNTAESEIDTLQTEMDAVEAKAAANEAAIGIINSTDATKVGSLAKNLADAKAYTDAEIGKTNDTVSGINTRLGTAEGEIDTLQSEMDAVEAKATANESAIASLTTAVDTKIEAAKTELSGEIADSINAANAMEYQGYITAKTDLPSTGVKIGDTYVVQSKFVDGGVTYHAGDMLIANGKEDDKGEITVATLTWDHVITGYVKEQDDKLKIRSNTLSLENYLGDTNGQLTFSTVAENQAGIIATVTGTEEDATITFGMQWGTF